MLEKVDAVIEMAAQLAPQRCVDEQAGRVLVADVEDDHVVLVVIVDGLRRLVSEG
jgi:hypothetical protein